MLYYEANNEKEIRLQQAASGIKCLAILELLYKNNSLNKDTLLVIDGPEVHLHPNLIVDYARLLILLQKNLGLTIFVASHNPDFVSAVRYISKKEKCEKGLSFYVAKKVEKSSSNIYDFKDLGDNIEDIFSSFNIALERISQYGEYDE